MHHSAIVAEGYRSLAEGAKVTYDAEAGDKGPKAGNVQLASQPQACPSAPGWQASGISGRPVLAQKTHAGEVLYP